MFLFIFESIGTSELLLVGIVALIFLGPRKMPQLARKIGKMMAEFRGTANEFKSTWEREVNFEEEAKLLNLTAIENETAARNETPTATTTPATPEVKEADAAAIEQLKQKASAETTNGGIPADPNDKKNWL